MAKNENPKFVDGTEKGDSAALLVPQCHSCTHWGGDMTCAAYPDGIPYGILVNAIDHTKKVEGDNGITYKKK